MSQNVLNFGSLPALASSHFLSLPHQTTELKLTKYWAWFKLMWGLKAPLFSVLWAFWVSLPFQTHWKKRVKTTCYARQSQQYSKGGAGPLTPRFPQLPASQTPLHRLLLLQSSHCRFWQAQNTESGPCPSTPQHLNLTVLLCCFLISSTLRLAAHATQSPLLLGSWKGGRGLWFFLFNCSYR